MEGGMQFPPYLYELFKRVKSIVVPEFLLYDFFFMSNLVLFQVRLQTQPLPVPGQPLYFLKLCPLFVGSTLYQFKSVIIFFLVLFQVRLQTQPLPAAGEKPMYSGAMDCVKKTIAKEGPKGLYKGKNS